MIQSEQKKIMSTGVIPTLWETTGTQSKNTKIRKRKSLRRLTIKILDNLFFLIINKLRRKLYKVELYLYSRLYKSI